MHLFLTKGMVESIVCRPVCLLSVTVCMTVSLPVYLFLFQDADAKEGSPAVNGLAGSVAAATGGIGELTFEDADEEDQFYSKDLPKHACS